MLKELMIKAYDLLEDVENVIYETEATRDNIEPYGDAYDLTEKQEEKLEWCEEVIDLLETITDNLNDGIYDIEAKIDE